jgi:hypothetical protein
MRLSQHFSPNIALSRDGDGAGPIQPRAFAYGDENRPLTIAPNANAAKFAYALTGSETPGASTRAMAPRSAIPMAAQAEADMAAAAALATKVPPASRKAPAATLSMSSLTAPALLFRMQTETGM